MERDTITGYINYRDWGNNPELIEFKDSLNGSKVLYGPKNIMGFEVNGEHYISASFDIDDSPSSTNSLDGNSTLKIENISGFLHEIIGNNKKLYIFKSNYYKPAFYVNIEGEFYLLKHKRYYRTENINTYKEKVVIAHNNKYKGQLNVFLGDCDGIQKKLKKTNYTKGSLIELFKFYHNSKYPEDIIVSDKGKIVFDFGAFAGGSMTSHNFAGTDFFEYLSALNGQKSSDFTAGLFFNITFPSDLYRWTLVNELQYTNFYYSGTHLAVRSDDIYVSRNLELGFAYLKMNNLIRYNYSIKKVKIFANLGMSNGVIIDQKNMQTITSVFYDNTKIKEEKTLPETRNHEQSIVYGLGINYKKFGLEFRQEKGNGMSVYTQLTALSTRNYLLLSYKF